MDSWRFPCDILYHLGCLQGNNSLVKEALGYIIEVIYFVPLVCHKCAVSIFSEADRGGNHGVIFVRFAVRSNMKSESVCLKALLDPLADVGDRLSSQGNPITTG